MTVLERECKNRCLMSRKWLILWSLWMARLVPQWTNPVQVSGGILRGMVAPDGSHVQYTGIPYATVPHRFQAPGPEPKWTGLLNAIDENVRCEQTVFMTDSINLGQRECLILNVYTPPNIQPNKKLPVLVFIHGGGYLLGSSTNMIYGPQYLVSKEVILVTLNYRLNVQGYLCLRIKEAPGNAGMKDQVAALKWIQRNIKAFGGDSDNVTLFGESAGAASVSFHVLSPMSKGLFHKAIIQSGSSSSPWTFQRDPIKTASSFAKIMSYDSEDPNQLYNYFESKSDKELVVTKPPRAKGETIISDIKFSVCTENVLDKEAFLTEPPLDILSQGTFNKIPMIIGGNSEEGLFLISSDDDEMIKEINFEKMLFKNLNVTEIEQKEVIDKLKQFYSGETWKLAKYYGEPFFNYPILEETQRISKLNPRVYSYIFNYYGWRNIPKLVVRKPYRTPYNATHLDELFYLFAQPIIPRLFDSKMIEKMTTLWTNFAKYGDPTPFITDILPVKWTPVQPESPKSLWIDNEFYMTPMWFTDSLQYIRDTYVYYGFK